MTGRIFISYRRDSAAGDARALAHDLDDAFGANTAFIDTAMPGGATWPTRLRDELVGAPVVLALIGPGWLTATDEWNRRRIDSSADWVRQEVELALSDPGKLLVPVLLDGTSVPPKEALPASLAGIVDRQARVLSHEMWKWQITALMEDIERHTGWRWSSSSAGVGRSTPVEAALERYTRAQLRRVETVLLTDGPTAGAGRRGALDVPAELVVPDLLPFQVDPPVTDRLTMDGAEHLRRATRDRARYSAEDLLGDVRPRRLAIVGGPGSGKTTLFIMITRAHATAGLAHVPAKVPVLLRVRDLSPGSEGSLTSELSRDATRWLDLDLGDGFFDELFESGRGMLLVDGVDEAPSVSRRNEVLTKIVLFAQKYEWAAVLVSSRIVGYDPRLLGRSFEHFELAPFSEHQARGFLTTVLGSRPARAAGAVPAHRVERLARRIVEDSRLSTFVENPLLLSIVARIVVERGTLEGLPRERQALYDVAVEMMLSDWDALRGLETAERPIHLDRGEMRRALETVAYRIHAGLAQRGSILVIESATLEHELTAALGEHGAVDAHRARWQARELLRYAVVRASLLVESGPGQFAFCHRAVQEHLAACAISSRGTGEVARYFAERGLHAPQWRNVNLLLVSMQRGEPAREIIEYVLDAGSSHEEWLHRDLLLVGAALGESPALVSSISEELAARVATKLLDICTASRWEVGDLVTEAAHQVLGSWRDTAMIATARAYLAAAVDRSYPVERHCAEALVGNTAAASDGLIAVLLSGDTRTADLAAIAVRNLDVDFQVPARQVDAVLRSIPRRAADHDTDGDRCRLPYTLAEVVAYFTRDGSARDGVLATFLAWVSGESNSACLRGAGATGLGWLRVNSAEVRESLIRMLLDRPVYAGDRSWPAYALFRLGGGEAEVVDAMLQVLADDAPVLCGWAQAYLSRFATRSSEVATRLAALAEDRSRPTLPWVLAASARLTGLTHTAIEQLESIAVSDPSIGRRAGAIEVLVQCSRTSSDWRLQAAERLASALASFLAKEPTEENVDNLTIAMQALGSLRVNNTSTWDLCRQFLRHDSEDVRVGATYGIGGLPTDERLGSRILEALAMPEVTGRVRGSLVDALHRTYTTAWPDH